MHLKLKFLQIMSKIADVSILETPTPLASANIGNGDTPPPLKHADVLNGWSLIYTFQKIKIKIHIRKKFKSWVPFRSCLINHLAGPI